MKPKVRVLALYQKNGTTLDLHNIKYEIYQNGEYGELKVIIAVLGINISKKKITLQQIRF